ncbi:hypothetical protein [Candidatus Ichthyocystis hellenicum]|uniref:hypothetical protein n=1 Tax=Candidatus Ichthyocystis hellenicum TaxID=1561003 RepID=UPI00111247ED|nr:hypothetical protein [Candidatus Ichthyocystis hellenicum]
MLVSCGLVVSSRCFFGEDPASERSYFVSALMKRLDALEKENLELKERIESYSILGGVSPRRSSFIDVSNFRVSYDGSFYSYYALVSVGRSVKERLFSVSFFVECEWRSQDGSRSRSACSSPGSLSFRYFSEIHGRLSFSDDHAHDKLLRVFLTVKDRYSSAKRTGVFDYSSS